MGPNRDKEYFSAVQSYFSWPVTIGAFLHANCWLTCKLQLGSNVRSFLRGPEVLSSIKITSLVYFGNLFLLSWHMFLNTWFISCEKLMHLGFNTDVIFKLRTKGVKYYSKLLLKLIFVLSWDSERKIKSYWFKFVSHCLLSDFFANTCILSFKNFLFLFSQYRKKSSITYMQLCTVIPKLLY